MFQLKGLTCRRDGDITVYLNDLGSEFVYWIHVDCDKDINSTQEAVTASCVELM